METSRPLLAACLAGRRDARITARKGLAPLALALASLVPRAATARESPPVTQHYLQYGVAFTAETVASPGSICPASAIAPCILGSGVGLAVRAGYRTRGPWYVGGAYEFSRQESSNLLRLGILQQLRAELRHYFLEGNRLVPYAAMGAGGALFGNEWGADTGGAVAFVGGGVEFQVSRTTVVGAALGYRPLVLRKWRDDALQVRADEALGLGFAHLVGGELIFEIRDPLPRW